MDLGKMVRDFESRHPAVQHLLSMLNVDHLTTADHIAAKYLAIGQEVANLLPDGPALQDALAFLAKACHRTLDALAELEGGTLDQAAAPAVGTPEWVQAKAIALLSVPVDQAARAQYVNPDGMDGSNAPAPAAALVPGRDHPITWTPDLDQDVAAAVAGVVAQARAELDQAAQEAATAPEGAGDQGAAIAAEAPAQEAAGTTPADSTPTVEGSAGAPEETGDSGPAGIRSAPVALTPTA